jgi:hypothetical protein
MLGMLRDPHASTMLSRTENQQHYQPPPGEWIDNQAIWRKSSTLSYKTLPISVAA